MIAHVICCNDSIEAVVLDDEDFAKKELEKLAKKHYKDNRFSFHNLKNYKEYRELIYWHLHTVNTIEKKVENKKPCEWQSKKMRTLVAPSGAEIVKCTRKQKPPTKGRK